MIGRCPTEDEVEEYQIRANVAVWLPTGSIFKEMFSEVVVEKIQVIRIAIRF